MDNFALNTYNYFDTVKMRNRLCNDYPFLKSRCIGRSVMGKDIYAFTVDSAKEYSLFIGGIHGCDNFTSILLYTFIEELCKAIKDDGSIEGLRVRRALDGRAVAVIPCLNPDGCEIASKGKGGCGNIHDYVFKLVNGQYKAFAFNARGSDLDLKFNEKNVYSEPETSAAANFISSVSVRHAILLEAGRNEIIKPCNDNSLRTSRMSEILVASTGYCIPSDEIQPHTDGFLNWFYTLYNKPAFKILPHTPHNTAELYKALREAIMLSAIM